MKLLRRAFHGDYSKFSQETGIPVSRLDYLFHGDVPTIDELKAISKATGLAVTQFMLDYSEHYLQYDYRNYEFRFKKYPIIVKADSLSEAFELALKRLEHYLDH